MIPVYDSLGACREGRFERQATSIYDSPKLMPFVGRSVNRPILNRCRGTACGVEEDMTGDKPLALSGKAVGDNPFVPNRILAKLNDSRWLVHEKENSRDVRGERKKACCIIGRRGWWLS